MAKKIASSTKITGNQKIKKPPQKLDYNQFLIAVQKKAYEKYQERINKEKSGDMLSDWLVAEKELKKKYTI